MKKAVPLLIILLLLATSLLCIVAVVFSITTSIPSTFLITATIVSIVALCGAAFSLYTEKRAKNRIQGINLNRKQ